MKSVIKKIVHPYPAALRMAREDHAAITGQPLMERPWYYLDTEAGYFFHDIFGCIGWPSEASDKQNSIPGYIGIVGVIRPPDLEKDVHYDPRDAKFLLLDEAQEAHVPRLIEKCLDLREKYGGPKVLPTFLGDPERFVTVVALANERIMETDPGSELLISPPDDFYVPKIFDNYVRAIRFAAAKGSPRLYFGRHDMLQKRVSEFKRDDPAVMAAGGLVYSLLNRCMWMDRANESTIFSVEEAA